MKLLPTLAAALLLKFALTPIAVSAEEPDRGQSDRLPNILFIVSDDHGWGDLPSNWDKTEVRLPTLEALAGELEHTDLALFELSKDVAEENDLRRELPEVYDALKKELVDHFSNINAEHPGGENPQALDRKEPKPEKTAAAPAPQRRTPEQFFKNRDRNGDGAITMEEFIGNPKGRNVPALTKRFKNLDSNHDGKLQREELQPKTE